MRVSHSLGEGAPCSGPDHFQVEAPTLVFGGPIQKLSSARPLLRHDVRHQCNDLALLEEAVLEGSGELALFLELFDVRAPFVVCLEQATHFEEHEARRVDVNLFAGNLEKVTARVENFLFWG